MAVRLRADERQAARHDHLTLVVISYSLISGTVAVVIGAAVSLAAPGLDPLALWSIVAAAVAVSAGLVYDSDLMRACCFACLRLLHRLAKPSTS
jgi:hypothetical protein